MTSRTIRVSADVYAAMQKFAKPFEDTPDTVLRRLLGLEQPQSRASSARSAETVRRGRSGLANLISSGSLLIGEVLVGRYKDEVTSARVLSGMDIQLEDGSAQGSPSAVARAITGHETNGMAFWHAYRGGIPVRLRDLRSAAASTPSRIHHQKLADLTLDLAREHFGHAVFERRELMNLVEAHLRRADLWTAQHDKLSASTSGISKGLAAIDWAVSSLKKDQRLEHVARNQWRVPQ